MAKQTKKFKSFEDKFDFEKVHSLEKALQGTLDTAQARFDESVDVAVRLGIDPKQSDQQVRGAVELPHGLGKKIKVLVFAKGDKEKEAQKAGADYVGAEDYIEKIQKGWLDFDKAVATPDMMATVAKVAKVLGPRGLMPNPKLGGVTMDVAKAVEAEKKGRLSFRVEKAGVIHVSIGRKSMGLEKLKENYLTFMSTLVKAKPASSKGVYIRSVYMSSTMGPSFSVESRVGE